MGLGRGWQESQWEVVAETWGLAAGRNKQAQGKHWRCSQQALLMNWMQNKKEKTWVTPRCLA